MATQTIPIPLPDDPAHLTTLLMTLEKNGLCQVQSAYIVTTTNPTTATLLRNLIAPPKKAEPKPQPTEEPEREPEHNTYTDPSTGETYTRQKMGASLRFEKFEPGHRFHNGDGFLEVFRNKAGKLKLRKVEA